jgi:RNA polymerase sigma factor (sigma-70 family)
MPPPKPEPDLIPTRESLLSRLRDLGDETSWSEFFHTYWRLIYEVALKSGLSDADAQEVVQETAISVFKKMPGFHYNPAQGKFKGWLLQITRRRIADQFRKYYAEDGGNTKTRLQRASEAELATLRDPARSDLDQIWAEEWEKHIFNVAVANVKKRACPEHYQLFDLYVVQKWSVSKITDTLGVRAGQVYLAKHRISALLKKEIRRLTQYCGF